MCVCRKDENINLEFDDASLSDYNIAMDNNPLKICFNVSLNINHIKSYICRNFN